MSNLPRLSDQGDIIKTALEGLAEGERLHADYIDGLQGLGYTGSKGEVGYVGSKGATGFAGSRGASGFTGSAGTAGAVGFTGSRGLDGAAADRGYTGSKGEAGTNGYAGSQGSTGYVGSAGSDGQTGFSGSAGIRGFTGSRGTIGFAGSRGLRGFTGSRAYTGSRGATGFVGSQGVIGYSGSRGLAGATGARGFTGSKGAAGTNGYQGSRGTQGYVGSVGPRGFTGSLGAIGFVGSRGTIGLTGATGARGYSGSKGLVGSKGDTGYVGSVGLQGFTGSRGVVGFVGSRGSTGLQGFVGSVGPRGFTGSKGAVGSTGGIGFTGSQGATGAAGSDGADGYVGSQGVTGFVGSQGEIGLQGFTGSIGYIGSQGFTGSRGATGYSGSVGAQGYAGSRGFTGSRGVIGYSGSQGATGFVGSTGDIGYTGSKGAGFTGSRGIQGELGFTGSIGYSGSQGFVGSVGYAGSQGIIGYSGSQGPIGYSGSAGIIGYVGSQGIEGPIGQPGVATNYKGDLADANSLPEANTGVLGDMYLIGYNAFIISLVDDENTWVDYGPFRGETGYVGSTGPQGEPGVIWDYKGTLETVEELPDANTAVENDGWIIDTNLYVFRANTWDMLPSYQGPQGDAGLLGYTGSQGAVGIRLNVKGTLSDIVDLPDANTAAEDDFYVVGSEGYAFTANGEWIGTGQIVGFVGSRGYTGSAGPMSLANTAAGANGSLQFNLSDILAGANSITFDSANNKLLVAADADFTGTIALGSFTVDDTAILFPNIEPSGMPETDGALSFDSSRGLLIHRSNLSAVGTEGVYTILDTGQVKAGNGITISGNSVEESGTAGISFAINPAYSNAFTAAQSIASSVSMQFSIGGTGAHVNPLMGFYANSASTRTGYIQSHSTDGLKINNDNGAQIAMSGSTTTFTGLLSTAGATSTSSGLRVTNDTENVNFYFTSSGADADFAINYAGSGAADILIGSTGDVSIPSGTLSCISTITADSGVGSGGIAMGHGGYHAYINNASGTGSIQLKQGGTVYASLDSSISNAWNVLTTASGANTAAYVTIGGSRGVMQARDDVSDAMVIRINSNGNILNINNSYTGISDGRRKWDIQPASSQWDDFMNLRFKKYFLEGDTEGTNRHLGVIAQEVLEDGMPGLVEYDSEMDIYSVKYSILYMKGMVALQEAMKEIDLLKARVAELEGN